MPNWLYLVRSRSHGEMERERDRERVTGCIFALDGMTANTKTNF